MRTGPAGSRPAAPRSPAHRRRGLMARANCALPCSEPVLLTARSARLNLLTAPSALRVEHGNMAELHVVGVLRAAAPRPRGAETIALLRKSSSVSQSAGVLARHAATRDRAPRQSPGCPHPLYRPRRDCRHCRGQAGSSFACPNIHKHWSVWRHWPMGVRPAGANHSLSRSQKTGEHDRGPNSAALVCPAGSRVHPPASAPSPWSRTPGRQDRRAQGGGASIWATSSRHAAMSSPMRASASAP